jgi:hypothetical protein
VVCIPPLNSNLHANPPPGYQPFNIPYQTVLPFVFTFDYLIDFAVLAAVFTILKTGVKIRDKKFAAYILIVTVGGMIIDFAVIEFVKSFLFSRQAIILNTEFLAFIFLAVYNFILAKLIYELDSGHAMLAAIAMGIFSNPALWMALLL